MYSWGHGESTFSDSDEATIESFVKSFREFLEITKLDSEKVI